MINLNRVRNLKSIDYDLQKLYQRLVNALTNYIYKDEMVKVRKYVKTKK